MLANVMDLETNATHSTLEEADPAIMLFDFAAASPSISQEFILSMLEQLRLPAPAVHLVRSLYQQHKGRMHVVGSRSA